MRIKVENILKNILNKFKFNFKFNKKSELAKVIKFSRTSENIKTENIEDNIDIPRVRKGAVKVEVEPKGKKVPIDKNIKKVFVAMVMLLILTTTLNIQYKDFFTSEDYQPKDVSSVSVSSNIDNVNTDKSTNEEIVKATKAEEKVVTIPKKAEEKLVFSSPLKGDIQKIYSIDKVIYSKTLQQWKTHDGIDIAASEGTEVKSIEKGVVDSVEKDPFYGTTIQIEHKSGYRSVYSNLDEKVYVSVGDSVIKGQKIGKVGNTSVGEYLDDPHLHFMLFLNDKSIDPTYIFQ